MTLGILEPDLLMMCMNDPSPDEKHLFPPDDIRATISRIVEGSAGSNDIALAESWITQQRQLQERAEMTIAALPPFDGGNMPGWMGQKWALILQAGRWSDRLAEALFEAFEWMTSNNVLTELQSEDGDPINQP